MVRKGGVEGDFAGVACPRVVVKERFVETKTLKGGGPMRYRGGILLNSWPYWCGKDHDSQNDCWDRAGDFGEHLLQW